MDALHAVKLVRHGMVRFHPAGGPVVYVDPFQMENAPRDADLVVVTHSHGDHFSPDDLARVAGPNTCYAVTAPVADWLAAGLGVPAQRINLLDAAAPALAFECGAAVTALPAENKNHPLGFGFGVLLEVGGARYYLSGDTDRLARVACDVLFVVCDSLYNMPRYLDQIPEQLARMPRPGVVVPYHYAGYMEGTDDNGPKLAKKLEALGYNVRLLCRP
ncbi:MAG TPA: MBL fold metallo-hydrolase [Candidatus Fournierella merdigallinarum]|nr:MBL fold metallo-hydrolase [Candidatus Fournierella merdigallinarum]